MVVEVMVVVDLVLMVVGVVMLGISGTLHSNASVSPLATLQVPSQRSDDLNSTTGIEDSSRHRVRRRVRANPEADLQQVLQDTAECDAALALIQRFHDSRISLPSSLHRSPARAATIEHVVQPCPPGM